MTIVENGPFANRTRKQIIADMLECLHSPTRKTAIMYGAKISYAQLRFYHSILLERGLITRAQSKIDSANDTRSEGFWVATEKGKDYLAAYATLKALGP